MVLGYTQWELRTSRRLLCTITIIHYVPSSLSLTAQQPLPTKEECKKNSVCTFCTYTIWFIFHYLSVYPDVRFFSLRFLYYHPHAINTISLLFQCITTESLEMDVYYVFQTFESRIKWCCWIICAREKQLYLHSSGTTILDEDSFFFSSCSSLTWYAF